MMNDKIIAVMVATVVFVGFTYLMNEIIEDYKYCKKVREERKKEQLDQLPKNLKM